VVLSTNASQSFNACSKPSIIKIIMSFHSLSSMKESTQLAFH
jgi:hypothetical protein